MKTQKALESWEALNQQIMTADEKACQSLLQYAREHRYPITYQLRIHSRYNRLRAARERRELQRAMA